MLIEIIFLQELSKDLSSNPHQLPAKVILIQRIGFSKKKKKKKKEKNFKKGLWTRDIGPVLLKLLSKKKIKIKIFNSMKKFKISKFLKKKKKKKSS